VSITKSLEEVGGTLAVKAPKTERAKRTVTVSQFTLDVLLQHRKAIFAEGNFRPDAPVFCGSRNKTYLRESDVYRHSFSPALKRAGLKFRFHDLRHACASMLLAAGSDVKTVQERLGHSSPIMTLTTYSHCLQGAQAEAAKKLDAILSAASNEKRPVVAG
jgi:integrase